MADIWKENDGFIFEGRNVRKEFGSVVFLMDIEILELMNTKLSGNVGHQSPRLAAPYPRRTDISNTGFV